MQLLNLCRFQCWEVCLLFNAPEIFTNIPDIAQMYDINETQSDELETALEKLDNNIFLDKMDAETCGRWENILEITAFDDDTLDDRRFRIKSKILEKLPYSYRVIVKKLDVLCPDGYAFIIDDARLSVTVKLSLKTEKKLKDVVDLLEHALPLNMTYVVTLMWNDYSTYASYTHAEMAENTHEELRAKQL